MEKLASDPIFDGTSWRRITQTLGLNLITVMLAIYVLDVFGKISVSSISGQFKETYGMFFWPFSKFGQFLVNGVLVPALVEETIFRGPVRILLALVLLKNPKPNKLALSSVWIFGVALTFFWAFVNHPLHGPLWITVFIAGLGWLALLIKTNRIWPAIVCHAVANLSIYLVIKVAHL